MTEGCAPCKDCLGIPASDLLVVCGLADQRRLNLLYPQLKAKSADKLQLGHHYIPLKMNHGNGTLSVATGHIPLNPISGNAQHMGTIWKFTTTHVSGEVCPANYC